MLGDTVYKMVMGLTPEDAKQAVAAGAGDSMSDLVVTLGRLAEEWHGLEYGRIPTRFLADLQIWDDVQGALRSCEGHSLSSFH